MEKLRLEDIKPLSEYESLRKDARRRIIELKKRRRILLGDRISLVFENRETIQFQIQEMVRAEHLRDPAKIQGEIDAYNPLIAGSGELSAVLFIEITEEDRIKEVLDRFQGLDNGRAVYLEVGPDRIYAQFEEGNSREDKISAVQYLRFRLTKDQQAALMDPGAAAALAADHPNYKARAPLNFETKQELARDMF
ncbi:MAG TPA: DUF3501 family protein [Nitrospiria bacterium]